MAGHNLLSKTRVKNAKGTDKKITRISDGGELYLCITEKGKKSWQFRYQKRHNKQKTFIGIGSYPEIDLEEAREIAFSFRKQIANNEDPKINRDAEKYMAFQHLNNTFAAVAQLWRESKTGRVKPKTIGDNWRKLEIHAFPTIGEIPINQITAPLAIGILKKIEQDGRLETVKRVGQLINEVMNFAVNIGLISINSLQRIRDAFQKPQVTHIRALKPDELPLLMQSLAKVNLFISTRYLIEWLLHTMVRPSEAAGAMWQEIDWENKVWIISKDRMKMKREHRVPLSSQAMQLLEQAYAYSSKSPYLFPSNRNHHKPTHTESINKALERMGLHDKTTAHGFRSLASTTLNEWMLNPDLIEAALAHVSGNKIRDAYRRTDYLEQRRELMQQWSDHIMEAAKGSFSVLETQLTPHRR